MALAFLGLPTIAGKTQRGCSSPAKPALTIPDPLSMTTVCDSVMWFLFKLFYLYDSNIFEAVNSIKPSERGELEISDAHQFLIENGYDVSYSEITGWWKDTGQPSDLLDANRPILDNIKDFNQYDLYSKEDDIYITDDIIDYYKDLLKKYFPEPLQW